MEAYKQEFIEFMLAFLRLPRMPRNAVLSRNCGLWVKMSRYRILSENGVVNCVVKLRRRHQISE